MDKLIIFDCDGVLVDSEIISNRIEAEILNSFNYSITVEENIKKFMGLDAQTVRRTILDECGINIDPNYKNLQQSLVSKAFEIELKSLSTPILEFLSEMQVSKCIASNSTKTRVIRSLELTKQSKYFTNDSIFTFEQVTKCKPSPDLFLFAANQMKFPLEKCIVIEDSTIGIEAAIAAQIKVIAFLGGSHTNYEWYEEKISNYNIPIAKDLQQLSQQLEILLNN